MIESGRIILPKKYVETGENPLIFLTGPCGGAPRWQEEAINIIISLDKNILIASPRDLSRFDLIRQVLDGDDSRFHRQRAWERYYLDLASKNGAIMFWLPKEEEHNCRKVYGAMTRLELGQCMTEYRHDNSYRFCIGSDGQFPELRTIEYDLSLDAPDKKILGTLDETCREAIRLALSSRT
jgi:hypothetical protein